MSGRRTLVTGATGFIGRHVVDRLLELERPVAVLVRPDRRLPAAWRGRVAAIECADWSEMGLHKALAPVPFDCVFHLAAYGVAPTARDVEQTLRINVAVAAALVRLSAERAARVVMAGTFSEYRRPAAAMPLTEDAPLESRKLYGASKAAGGLLASALATELGVALRLLRLFKVYGPGEAPHRLLPTLARNLPQAQRVPLSAGTQILDFVYVKDVIDACLHAEADMASASGRTAATWNVCTGTGHSVQTFAATAARILQASPDLLGFGDIPMRPDDEPWLVGSGERMYAAIGWRPAFDLAAGVRDALAGVRVSDLALRSPSV
jgi:nucleoside-diphosphate-sugar epimerase